MSNQRWVTLATNDSYGLGALVLAHSLRRVGSAYPAVVLITPSVTEAMRNRLGAVFDEVVTVDVLDSRDAAHLALLQRPELGITFTKIHCWNLTQYEKCVFLDADTLVVQNCDELFEREELSAAPDVGWPDCFNSGVFVFRPSADTFAKLITFAAQQGSFDGGDQGLLNSYFSDWAHGDINKHLPFLYNVTSAAFYSYIPALKHYGQNLKIIHFIGAIKPWLQQYNWESRSVEAPEHLRTFLQLWWDLFVTDVHVQLDTTMIQYQLPQWDQMQYGFSDFTVHDRKYLAIPFIMSSKSIHSHISLRSHEYNMCSKHTTQESIVDEEDAIEEDSSAVLQQEFSEFREPVLHSAYYEPILDPDSEFSWHHPDNQIPDSEINVPAIDMSQFHDPWNMYRGHIPPSTEQYTPTEQTIDDYQDMRKYAWDYMPPQQEKYDTNKIYSTEQMSSNNYSYVNYVPTHSHTPSHSSEHLQQKVHYHSFDSQSYNIHNRIHQYLDNFHDHTQQHFQANSYHDTQTDKLHTTYEQQIFVSNREGLQNSHDHHYTYNDRSQDHDIFSKVQSDESLTNNHVSNITYHDQIEPENRKKERNFYSQIQNQNNTEHVYTVMMDHCKMRSQQISEELVNGYDTDSDSDVYEEVQPRHPYDGFYLRHRMTIDSHGRKICSHEIPFIPRSPTPDSTEEFEDALETLDDVNYKTVIDEDIQTGVAGNLARVVPGTPLQREAVDELTRRQGWEAGNIDYMGADSFDNIWAKISQTLSEPPAPQSEQSLESQPMTEPQQISEPVAVEAKMEVVEAIAEKQSVLPETEELAQPGEKDETAITTPGEVEIPNTSEPDVPKSVEPELSNSAKPEIPIPAEPEVPKSTDSEISKPADPEIPKPADPEVPTPAEPEVPKLADPEVPKPAEPEVPKLADPEVSKLAEPEVPTPADPVTSKPAESEIPKPAEPEIPKPTDSEISKPADPEISKPTESSEVPESAAPVSVEGSTPNSKESEPSEVPVPKSATLETSSKVDEPIPIPAETAAEIPATIDVVVPVEPSAPAANQKSEQTEFPVAALEALKIDEPLAEASLPVTVVEQAQLAQPVPDVPTTPVTEPLQAAPAVTPEPPAPKLEVGSDSPPLANTPSKEEIPVAPAAKSEERRKPAGKLQLRPPAVADPLPTPDSELEDAATLAHAIIASELRTPTVTAPSPPALCPSPAAAPLLSRLSVQEPEVPSPPVDSVSLTQIGVKPKPSTAARIESSVSAKTDEVPKSPEAAEAPKKKIVKKVLKKDKEGSSTAEAPVPPPRKKEKKPKEK